MTELALKPFALLVDKHSARYFADVEVVAIIRARIDLCAMEARLEIEKMTRLALARVYGTTPGNPGIVFAANELALGLAVNWDDAAVMIDLYEDARGRWLQQIMLPALC